MSVLLWIFLLAFPALPEEHVAGQDNNQPMNKTIKIKIGTQTFTAKLSNNESATALFKVLPLSLKMIELNGNEKYAQLPIDLPTKEVKPSAIEVGDLMLYGSNTLVLFYKSFSTNYRYTKLGKVADTAGLANALSSSNMQVTIALE